jgi:hypothetical protein
MLRCMPRWVIRRFPILALPLLTSIAPLGCGASTPTPRTPRNVPPYDSHSAELFDDGIEPDAVGFTPEHSEKPSSDNKLRERAQVGDAVLRARVTTVNEDSAKNWQLDFQTLEVLHAGGREKAKSAPPPTPYDSTFSLTVEPTDPSFGIVNSMMTRLVGHTFVVYLRTFAHGTDPHPADDPDLHFHVATDSKDEIDAVRSAIVLGEVQ